MEDIAQIGFFTGIVCKCRCRFRFYLFGENVGNFADFFRLENRLENETIFCYVTDPEFGLWRGRSRKYLGPVKT